MKVHNWLVCCAIAMTASVALSATTGKEPEVVACRVHHLLGKLQVTREPIETEAGDKAFLYRFTALDTFDHKLDMMGQYHTAPVAQAPVELWRLRAVATDPPANGYRLLDADLFTDKSILVVDSRGGVVTSHFIPFDSHGGEGDAAAVTQELLRVKTDEGTPVAQVFRSSPAGNLTIAVRLLRDGGESSLRFSDSGAGLAPTFERKLLFEQHLREGRKMVVRQMETGALYPSKTQEGRHWTHLECAIVAEGRPEPLKKCTIGVDAAGNAPPGAVDCRVLRVIEQPDSSALVVYHLESALRAAIVFEPGGDLPIRDGSRIIADTASHSNRWDELRVTGTVAGGDLALAVRPRTALAGEVLFRLKRDRAERAWVVENAPGTQPVK